MGPDDVGPGEEDLEEAMDSTGTDSAARGSANLGSGNTGRRIETVVPRPAPVLSTSTLPPLAMMKALVIHNPSPEPEVVVACRGPRKNRSPTWRFSSAVRPAPQSCTEIKRACPSAW
ncbi:MAG TPA: hypothetical protein VGJ20_27760, partial [Xanthobacteraceae bacterium]